MITIAIIVIIRYIIVITNCVRDIMRTNTDTRINEAHAGPGAQQLLMNVARRRVVVVTVLFFRHGGPPPHDYQWNRPVNESHVH